MFFLSWIRKWKECGFCWFSISYI